jgi:flagellar basal body-associated protein FliL
VTAPVSPSVGPGTHPQPTKGGQVSILWIILIVILVLALLGFFSRGYW